MRPPSQLLRVLASALVLLFACSDGDVRGRSERSQDGGTYFAFEEDNGAGCRPLFVDSVAWPHALGVRAPVRPGAHIIGCGMVLDYHSVAIDSGSTFYFQYWGP